MKEKIILEQQLNTKIDELKICIELKNSELNKNKIDYENMTNILTNDITFKDKKILESETRSLEKEKYFAEIKNNLDKELLGCKAELSTQMRVKGDLEAHTHLLTSQNSDLGNRINLIKHDAESNNLLKINEIRNLEEKSNVLTHERFALEVDLRSKVDELQRNLDLKINENKVIKNEADNITN
jgi:hypothetical protein